MSEEAVTSERQEATFSSVDFRRLVDRVRFAVDREREHFDGLVIEADGAGRGWVVATDGHRIAAASAYAQGQKEPSMVPWWIVKIALRMSKRSEAISFLGDEVIACDVRLRYQPDKAFGWRMLAFPAGDPSIVLRTAGAIPTGAATIDCRYLADAADAIRRDVLCGDNACVWFGATKLDPVVVATDTQRHVLASLRMP
jgi:hypothetical protein